MQEALPLYIVNSTLMRIYSFKKMLLVIISISFIACLCYLIYPIYRYGTYIDKEREKLSSGFLVKLPLHIDNTNHFRISCIINDLDTLDLIVDTKATSLMRKEDIDKYNGKYWGKLPFHMANAYSKKESISLFTFNQFKIDTLSIGKPIFQKIDKDNLIYTIIDKGVLGSNILSLLYWKFSVDEQQVTLFSKHDSSIIKKETEGFIPIKYGLINDSIHLSIKNREEPLNFTLDMGFSGEIEINNKLATSLMNQFPHTTIETLRDDGSHGILHLFENRTVVWNGITIHNCQLVNIPDVDANYIGAALMKRFNFILGYGTYIKHNPQYHLYIKPKNDFIEIKSNPYISKFGFNIEQLNGKIRITAIEQKGIASKKGLKLGDEIFEIDNINCSTERTNILSNFILYTQNKKTLSIKLEKEEVELVEARVDYGYR